MTADANGAPSSSFDGDFFWFDSNPSDPPGWGDWFLVKWAGRGLGNRG